MDAAIEDAVVQFSVEHPHLGQQKVALKLTAALGVDISPGGVRGIWLRQNMNTTALRVEKAQAWQESAWNIASLATGWYSVYKKLLYEADSYTHNERRKRADTRLSIFCSEMQVRIIVVGEEIGCNPESIFN